MQGAPAGVALLCILTVLMEKRPLRHRVERTRNKHSRAVCHDDTIVIRLARNLSKTEEREHIQNLLRRMTHLVLQEKQKTLINPFRHLLEGGQSQTVTLSTGRQYVMTLEAGPRTRAKLIGNHWKISVGPGLRRSALHRFLWSLIARSESERIEALVHAVNNETYRYTVRGVTLKFATTQWGSCSPKGIIMLNSALLFLPPSLLKYVIIHELAHRRYPNHSAAYWREVESELPSYRIAYEKLHGYRLPTL